ncbi:MAG TPA: MBL fold metallo-hydrolase [Salegentibacter sp.]|nr:MBL fold metallo-hydrolase [Salegentibacter sp.]
MKHLLGIMAFGLIFTGCKNETGENREETKTEVRQASEKVEKERAEQKIDIRPVSHATAVITWDDAVIYLDPVGGAEAFSGMEKPGLVIITDIHGDHMNAETLQALDLENVQIIAPQEVMDELPEELHEKMLILANGDSEEVMGFEIEAVPMYNFPEDDPDSRHPKGRGNGYIIEKDDSRFYISGDTEDIPEMRELKDIDIALVTMNLPYTMSVEQAADAVLAFKPKQVYPYHYRGQDGLADVDKFKSLVNDGDGDIEVVQLDWYPERD